MFSIMKQRRSASTESQTLLSLAEGREILSQKEIKEAGLSRTCVSRLVRSGELERLGRGLYRHPSAPISEHHDLLMVMSKAPSCVIALISALYFHKLGTQLPRAVWIQIMANAREPRMERPAIEIVRTRLPELMTEGVDQHQIGGVTVAITNPARTVADCFKHRNRVGVDVAVEALKELLKRDRNSMNDLMLYAKTNRVDQIMMPYVTAAI